MPLLGWRDDAALLEGAIWPSIDRLNNGLRAGSGHRFVAQTPALLADGLHYEQRIAERGEIATREHNWHDLLNALVWLRHPTLKQALNRRRAWLDGTIRLELFGHALLELALDPARLLVAKALVFQANDGADTPAPVGACAVAVAEGRLLRDPLELRPLPLSGIPGWHPDNASESFHLEAPCYQPRRAGRAYPPLNPPLP